MTLITKSAFTSFILAGILFCIDLNAQEGFPVNGVPDRFKPSYLLENATIVDAEKPPYKGHVLVRDGIILGAGPDIRDSTAIRVDLSGMYVYPSFIDLYTQYGLAPMLPKRDYNEQFLSDKPGAYGWNEAIRSEFRAHEHFTTDLVAAENWRRAGFGAVLTHLMDGICRGSGAMVFTGDEEEHNMILKEMAAHHLSLRKGSSTQDYPYSQMGAIALLRQTYHDGSWHASNNGSANLTLDAWNELQELPEIVESSNLLVTFRVDRIGDEFARQYIIKGSGTEYRRLESVKATNAPLIIPVIFPNAYDVEDPRQADIVTLENMKHWELAPYNAAFMERAGLRFAITSEGHEDKAGFLAAVRKAVRSGLSEKAALASLTTVPASLVGMEDAIGTIREGLWANLLVTDLPVFHDSARIYQHWVRGVPYMVNSMAGRRYNGTYRLMMDSIQLDMELALTGSQGNVYLDLDTGTVYCGEEGTIRMTMAQALVDGAPGYMSLTGHETVSGWEGTGMSAEGGTFSWRAALQSRTLDTIPETGTGSVFDPPTSSLYPFVAYGRPAQPVPGRMLFRNATVWTNGQDGILEHCDVLIDEGRILKVGKGIKDKRAEVVDASGMHLTSGIIDEHSHICISSGVNEGSQASSAEVRIGDVINSEDINMYRQLAGGVTAAQLLHGSANPIGGQSALIKFRWGLPPEDLKIGGADGFIKFALGENVKKGNDARSTKRFPQTRMGVEQVFMDHFTRAAEYGKQEYKRRDLEMDALLEILQSRRFITCHSYVQSEINMMMKVAEKFGFRMAIFTHILEGYKVADKMKEHGVAASTFADWWTYKFEVIDAIPYNAALLNEAGVLTAINSDDAEMGRRLNHEAAKAVKYGGVSEEDAWKMITLNPAIMLHLDDRMGSIETDKDADIVLWTDHPLSVYARVDQTWVDGIRYYERDEHEQLQRSVAAERQRLIQKMLEAKKGGADVVAPEYRPDPHYHCDDLEEWGSNRDEELK